MAKIADVFGRLEAFSISILLYVLGYIQMSAARNVQTFAAAQIFSSSGSTGLQILQQVFVADTSDMLNRALLSSLPETPFLVTTWIGSVIADTIINNGKGGGGWRWACGIWAIILPVTFLPLALTLFLNARRAKKTGLLKHDDSASDEKQPEGVVQQLQQQQEQGRHENGNGDEDGDEINNNNGVNKAAVIVKGLARKAVKTWYDLDVGGILLLSASFALILIPLTIAQTTPGGWHSATIVSLFVLGGVLLVIFPFWEASKSLAPHPLIPPELLRSRTFCAGCGIAFVYFSKSACPAIFLVCFCCLHFRHTCKRP